MAFKFIIIAAFIAVAQAGGPAAYDIATASADYASVAYTQESTHKGLGGQNVISSFSKAVDSPYSSVRVSNNRVSNDGFYAQALAPAYTYAAHAPVLAKATYAAPILAKAYSPAYSSISAPVVAKAAYALPSYSYAAPAAPIVAKAAYALPSYSYAAAAPVVAKAAYALPSYNYAAAAAPVVAKAAYVQPTYSYAAAAPVLAKAAYAAPAYGYAASAPLVAKAAYAAATPIVHTSFDGYGIHYAY
ncbi:hypothetical protein PV327_009933 [Microctonus hyperodae]|uniref:Uncharacterized protein n=1 Tax=Microctonus hyperodae TaxID=165561 RepID=A0AA39F207_MICHY|nr:hypothetical protein PV327_009933 [Microctonus hyperodae]